MANALEVPTAVDMGNNAWGIGSGAAQLPSWMRALTTARTAGQGGLGAVQSATQATGSTGFMNGLGGVMGGVGGVLGGISLVNGIKNIADGEGSQGMLDVVSGGLGMASGFGGMAAALGAKGALASTLACPPLAIAAGLAGLASFGNGYAQENGWYGTDEKGENRTLLGMTGDMANTGGDVGRSVATMGGLLDNVPILGSVLGGVGDLVGSGVGGALGLARGGITAIGGGLARGASAIGSGLSSAGSFIASLLSDGRLKRDIAPIASPLDVIDLL